MKLSQKIQLTLYTFTLLLWLCLPAQCDDDKYVLKVGYLPLVSHLPIVVANRNEKFSYNLIDAVLSKYSSSTTIEAALRVGAIDAAFVSVPIALSMAADEIDIRVVGSFTLGGSVLFAKKSGDFASLKGKIIGIPGLDSNETIHLRDALDTYNLRYGIDYKTISVPASSIIEDLTNGRIHALYYPEPYGTIAMHQKIAYSILGQEHDLAGNLTNVLVVHKRLLNKPYIDGLKEWIQSLIEATTSLANCTLDEDYNSIPTMGYDSEIIKYSLSEHRGKISFKPAPPNPEQIREYLEKVIQLKILYKSIAIENLVYPDLMVEMLKNPGEQ